MTLLVFGKGGQLSIELLRLAPEARFLGQDEADLTSPQTCADWILDLAPSAVINAAAFTAVDAAEENEETAQVINADAPGAMARACAKVGAPLVQVSTDYVFDGSGSVPSAPSDPTGPLGAYGRTKLAGEHAVAGAGCDHAILRTSWVFSAHGQNFVKTMLRLAGSHERLTIVADQIGGPTPAADLAVACLEIAGALKTDPSNSGVYHFSGAPDVSWADFAREIFAQTKTVVDVVDIPTSDYPTPAPRPLNSRLDCRTTKAVFGIERPDWRAGLRTVLADLAAEGQ